MVEAEVWLSGEVSAAVRVLKVCLAMQMVKHNHQTTRQQMVVVMAATFSDEAMVTLRLIFKSSHSLASC